MAGLLALYIFQVNAITAQVYLLSDQQEELESLKEQRISFKALRLPAMSRDHMEELASRLQFERVQTISYLRVLGGVVAQTTGQE